MHNYRLVARCLLVCAISAAAPSAWAQATSPGDKVPTTTSSDEARQLFLKGRDLAEKLRGAVALQMFRIGGDDKRLQQAIEHLTKALAFWDELIRITRPLYKDMKLTHYNGNSFDANPDNLFHWERIRAEVAADLEVARRGR